MGSILEENHSHSLVGEEMGEVRKRSWQLGCQARDSPKQWSNTFWVTLLFNGFQDLIMFMFLLSCCPSSWMSSHTLWQATKRFFFFHYLLHIVLFHGDVLFQSKPQHPHLPPGAPGEWSFGAGLRPGEGGRDSLLRPSHIHHSLSYTHLWPKKLQASLRTL